MKIVYMGTPDFAVGPLAAIAEAGYEIGYAVTQQDKARNRGKKIQFTPVKTKAMELDIPVLQPERVKGDEEFLKTLEEYAPDVIVVAAYGQILPEEVLTLPKYGCINIHASLLPRHRGAAPIQRAILCGDEKTGVTIMQMEKGLDTGDMLLKKECSIDSKTADELHDELAEMGAQLIVEFLDRLSAGNPPEPVKQDDSLSTYAPMIFKEDGRIDFDRPAEETERQIRALSAYTMYNGEIFKIWKAEVKDAPCGMPAGTVVSASDEGIEISAGGRLLNAQVVQVPGKRRMEVKDFLRGNSIETGTVLG